MPPDSPGSHFSLSFACREILVAKFEKPRKEVLLKKKKKKLKEILGYQRRLKEVTSRVSCHLFLGH